MAASTGVGSLIVAALVGGVVGGGVVAFVNDSGRAANGAAVRAEDKPPEDDGEQVEQGFSDGADSRVAQLEKRIRVLERRSAAATELRKYAETLNADRGDAGAGEAPEASAMVDAEDPVFALAVRSVVDEWDNERQEERQARRNERRQERRDRHLENLTDKLGLSSAQKRKVAEILDEHFQRRRALWERDAGRPVTRSDWREAMGNIRRESEQELKDLLDEEQLESYETLSEEGDSPFSRGGGRRRGRGD